VHPQVLARILACADGGAHLGVQVALLPSYVAHRVSHAEYPGLAPCRTATAASAASSAAASCVRGVVVRGLTAHDVAALDAFEGDEYVRAPVQALVLGAPVPNSLRVARDLPHLFAHLSPERIARLLQQQGEQRGEESMVRRETVQTYIWRDGEGLLEQEWRWEHFVDAHARRWVSGERN
jgi:hypothetical protein